MHIVNYCWLYCILTFGLTHSVPLYLTLTDFCLGKGETSGNHFFAVIPIIPQLLSSFFGILLSFLKMFDNFFQINRTLWDIWNEGLVCSGLRLPLWSLEREGPLCSVKDFSQSECTVCQAHTGIHQLQSLFNEKFCPL